MPRSLLLVSALIAVALSAGPLTPATQKIPNCGFGNVDLSGLNLNTGDYTGADAKYNYKMNVCGLSNTADCMANAATICQWNKGGSYVASLGEWNGSPNPIWSYIDKAKPELGVAVQFTNGDMCWRPGQPITRVVNVQFVCKQGFGTNKTFSIDEDSDTCIFTMQLTTDQACPPGPADAGGLSGGSAFLIILLVVVILYVVGGCIYMRKRKGTQGMKESCPNNAFWFGLPGLVKDGCLFTFGKMRRGIKGGGGPPSYDSL